MNRGIVLGLCLTLAGLSAHPVSAAAADAAKTPGAIVLTLQQCIATALQKSPDLAAASGTVDVGRSRVGQARSAWYPQIGATGSLQRIGPPSGSLTGGTVTDAPYNRYQTAISLNQTLLDFGRTSSQVDIAKENLLAAKADLQTQEDAVILNVKQAYYGVLQAKRNRDVAADVLRQYQLHLEQAKGFYAVGVNAKIDVIKAEVDLSNAKLGLINAENALKIAWVTLNNAMGVPDAPEYTIEDNLSAPEYSITLEDATAKALANRPDLLALEKQCRADEAGVSYARAGNYPVFSGSAEYTWTGEQPPLQQGWDAGVAVTFPLFNGFLVSQRIAEAKSTLTVDQARKEALRQQILLQVRQDYLNLQAAHASIATAELAAQQAKENLDLANGRYATGVGSPIEVSDAFATYVSAQAAYTGALYQYKIAQANLENAMGER